MSNPQNPYIAGRAILDDQNFFGRKEILDRVLRELNSSESSATPNPIMLFGQRRIGKTTLLLKLRRSMSSERFVLVYFDLHKYARTPIGEVLADLAERIIDDVSSEINVSKFKTIRDELIKDDSGRVFRKKFLPTLNLELDNRLLVLLLDEFEVLDKVSEELPHYAAVDNFFQFLSELLIEFKNLSLVFTIGRDPTDFVDLNSNINPIIKTALDIQVWVLDHKSARSLILQADVNKTLKFSDDSIDHILSLTNGHPFLTQLLCQRLWDKAYTKKPKRAPQIGIAEVDAVIDDTLATGGFALEWLWNGLSVAEKLYASAIAGLSEENEEISEAQVIQVLSALAGRLGGPQEIERPAPWDLLLKRKFLEVTEGQNYYFTIELLRRWVRINRPLHIVKDELDRINETAYGLFIIGRGLYNQKKLEAAKEKFDEALIENPRHLLARLYLGETLLKLGQLSDAVKVLREAYRLDQDQARVSLVSVLLAYAQKQYDNGEYNPSLEICEEVLVISPNEQGAQALNALIWNRKGDEALAEKNWVLALDAFQKAGNQAKIDALKERQWAEREQFRASLWWNKRGEQAYQYKDWHSALDAYQKAGNYERVQDVREKLDEEKEEKLLSLSSGQNFRTVNQINQGNPILGLTISPDNIYIASNDGKNVIVWGSSTGRRHRILEHSDRVSNLCFSPNENKLATASRDGKVTLWDVGIGKQIKAFTNHTGNVNWLSYSSNGKILASCGNDQIILWDVEAGVLQKELTNKSGSINCICFSSSQMILASGEGDSINFWDIQAGRIIKTINEDATVTCLSFSADGASIVSGLIDGTINHWNWTGAEKIRSFVGHNSIVNNIVFLSDNLIMVSAAKDQYTILWSLISGEKLRTLDGQSVALSVDGKLLVTGGQDGIITAWEVS